MNYMAEAGQDKPDKKFIVIDGKLKKNKFYVDHNAPPPPYTPLSSNMVSEMIVPVCSVMDMVESNLPQTEDLITATTALMDRSFIERYDGKVKNSSEILEMLDKLFLSLEVPVGLLNKLLAMVYQETVGEVDLDDSGSMNSKMNTGKTRWEEAIEQLRFITQVYSILRLRLRVRGLNRYNLTSDLTKAPQHLYGVKEVSTKDKTIDQVDAEWKSYCDDLLSFGPPKQLVDGAQYGYGTPTHASLTQVLKDCEERGGHSSIYLIFDGCPTDATTQQMCDLLLQRKRPKPELCPVIMIGCTDNDTDLEWASEVEEQATTSGHPSYLATMDDYDQEFKEVLHDQGDFFMGFYTLGTYRICQLCAASNPYDLDALDDDYPFTRGMLNGLMGREVTYKEFDVYLDKYFNNQHRTSTERRAVQNKYSHLKDELCRMDIASTDIPDIAKIIANKGQKQQEKRKNDSDFSKLLSSVGV